MRRGARRCAAPRRLPRLRGGAGARRPLPAAGGPHEGRAQRDVARGVRRAAGPVGIAGGAGAVRIGRPAARPRRAAGGPGGPVARADRVHGRARAVDRPPDGAGGWELSIVRHGRLAAAGVAPRGVPPMPVFDRLRAGAETVYETGPRMSRTRCSRPMRCTAPAPRRRACSAAGRCARAPGSWTCRAPGASRAHGAGRWLEWARRAMEAGRDARAAAAHPRGPSTQYSEEATHAA